MSRRERRRQIERAVLLLVSKRGPLTHAEVRTVLYAAPSLQAIPAHRAMVAASVDRLVKARKLRWDGDGRRLTAPETPGASRRRGAP